MVEDRETESKLPEALRKWALENEYAQRGKKNRIHAEMAVYLVAEKAFLGLDYEIPIYYESLNAQVERMTNEIRDSKGGDRINLYARAWITRNQVLEEEGIRVLGT